MKFKKTISVLLSLLIVGLMLVVPSFAENALPESDHNYADNTYAVWDYSAGEAASGLLVSFSDKTYVEPFVDEVDLTPVGDTLTVGDVMHGALKTGDYIAVLDGRDDLVGLYSGDELAGETVYVDGSSFSVVLSSDASESGYGFAVTNVIPIFDLNSITVTYHSSIDDSSYSRSYSRNYGGSADSSYSGATYEGKALAGWAIEKNGKVVYDLNAALPTDVDSLDLWAVWVDLCFGVDEKFTFNNSKRYFTSEDRTGYYISSDDYRTMQMNLFKIYGLGPVPSPILAIVLSTYPNWDWRGSCYGMSTVAALQHFGKIDVLSLQKASSLSELEADDALISYINYYQSQAATSWLTENKAAKPGSLMYKTQLQNMFNTVREGNLVLFTFYKGDAFVTAGHTVLLTGAYDDAQGNHVIITYDCNRPWNYEGDYASRFVVSSDYSSISYDDTALGAINWTANFDQFDSFSIKFDGDAEVWYARLFAHFQDFFNTLLQAIQNLFRF